MAGRPRKYLWARRSNSDSAMDHRDLPLGIGGGSVVNVNKTRTENLSETENFIFS